MPLPSYARVRNPANGREIIVRINDRGPFHGSRIIDLSYAAAARLGTLKGVVPVEVERLTHDEIRAGTWRRPSPGEPAGSPVFAATPPATGAVPVAGSAAVVGTVSGAAAGTTGVSPSTSTSTSTGADATAVARVTTAPTEPGPDDAPAPAATEALVPARATPIETVRGDAAPTVAARGYWVQLGAFRERGGAESFQQRVVAELDWLSPLLAVFADAPLYRLQAGPYPSRDEAQGAAQRVREALQLVPVIIERR
jgi:rare lipoprotein A